MNRVHFAVMQNGKPPILGSGAIGTAPAPASVAVGSLWIDEFGSLFQADGDDWILNSDQWIKQNDQQVTFASQDLYSSTLKMIFSIGGMPMSINNKLAGI